MYPEWYPVPCDVPQRADVLCTNPKSEPRTIKNSKERYIKNYQINTVICHQDSILFWHYCYRLNTKRTTFSMTKSQFKYDTFKLKTPYRNVFAEYNIILKYLSLVNENDLIFTFPADDKASKLMSYKFMEAKNIDIDTFTVFQEIFKCLNLQNITMNVFWTKHCNKTRDKFNCLFINPYSPGQSK